MQFKYLSIEEKQRVSLDALVFLDDYCRKNGLRYYLAYGTLIGAVRHKGFIPWDDDIDVHIPRPDYEYILSNFNDPNGNFELYSCFSDKEYILPYAKIQNKNTARVIWGERLDHQGIGIDLFPLDGIPEDLEVAEREFLKQNKKWLKVTNRLERFRGIKPNTGMNYLKSILGKIAFSSGFLSRSIKELSISPFNIQYEEASKVATLVGLYSGKFRPFKKEWFNPSQVDFSGYRFTAPSGYHEILSLLYGDYMHLPPEDERRSTHTDLFIWRI